MTWVLQDAKSKFSAVADTAFKGTPLVVTRHGHPLVAVISYELYKSKIAPEPVKNIAEAFMSCPVDVDFDKLIPPRKSRRERGQPIRQQSEAAIAATKRDPPIQQKQSTPYCGMI